MVILHHNRMPVKVRIRPVLHLRLRDANHITVIIVESIPAPVRDTAYLAVISNIFVVFVKPICVFIMPIRLHRGSNKNYHIVSYLFNDRIFINSQAISQLHRDFSSSGFTRMKVTGQPVNGFCLANYGFCFFFGFHYTWISQLSQEIFVFFQVTHGLLVRYSDNNHLPPFGGLAYGENLYIRGSFCEGIHILEDVLVVG